MVMEQISTGVPPKASEKPFSSINAILLKPFCPKEIFQFFQLVLNGKSRVHLHMGCTPPDRARGKEVREWRKKSISLEDAIAELEKEIATAKEDLKQRQIGLTMKLEVKTGTSLTNKELTCLANSIRLCAETRIYGVGRGSYLEGLMVNEKDIAAYLDK